ncbi:hypothetical protein D3C85_1941030 [compost metagenome]
MDVVAFGVENPAKLAGRMLLPGEDSGGVVVAGLAHRVDQFRLADGLDDALDLFFGDGHGNR